MQNENDAHESSSKEGEGRQSLEQIIDWFEKNAPEPSKVSMSTTEDRVRDVNAAFDPAWRLQDDIMRVVERFYIINGHDQWAPEIAINFEDHMKVVRVLDARLDIIRYRFSQDERFTVERPNHRKIEAEASTQISWLERDRIAGVDSLNHTTTEEMEALKLINDILYSITGTVERLLRDRRSQR
ncbi:uncharacterized protein H6S33_004506 [Morchella sextelata]|uniref:uncharacterized protein n=1 Tax=Morchella sextelata TaxID=1174677 RepID=UPI001D0567D8|nr:uncharacterized protein H6S33_004506 [Morchella sextelata]KAH0606049.1 hypothetical protein H6S33_004506 [Morchella sextelata]